MADLNPDKWLVAIAGFVNDWLYSRQWSRIFLYSIPAFVLLLLAGAVFAGGILNKSKLRNKYLELGQAELERWQNQLAKPAEKAQPTEGAEASEGKETGQSNDSTGPNESDPPNRPGSEESEPAAETTEQSDDPAKKSETNDRQLSPYAEMLFRRAHLLEPSAETQFVIGATLWQRGAISNAQQTLEKIAPTDQRGYPPAHAILAKICREEFVRTRNPALFEQFQHHANIAVDWPKAFPDVLLEQANLLWQQRKVDEALKYLTQASKSYPELYVLLVERAKQAGQTVLAQTARKDGIEHFQTELAKDPKSEKVRIQLAQLHVLEPDGDQLAEAVLVEGQNLKPSKLYARALSEIYRIRFTRKLESTKGQSVDISLLERALQLDTTNPEIAQTVAALMRSGIKASEQLETELNRILASGQATMATHAILSEYHLQNGRFSQAKTHLEQVHRLAPLSVKYANNLAFLYAKEGRAADAEKVAVQTLTLIKQNGAQREPFVDELFDTLGMIYQSQEKISDAISSYEASLKLNPQRTETRTRLVALYRKNGNDGVAKAHEEAIRAIEKAKAEAAKNIADQKKANAAITPAPGQPPATAASSSDPKSVEAPSSETPSTEAPSSDTPSSDSPKAAG